MLTYLLAAAGGLNPFEPPPLEYQPTRIFGVTMRDALLIVGAALLLGAVLFLWVYLTRKDRGQRPEYGEHVLVQRDGSQRHRRRRRRHHHRSEDRPEDRRRNPTLQETGGLPPIRPDEPAGPARPSL
jgi:hypothetical protein